MSSIRIPATEVTEGDNLYLSSDTGIRVASAKRIKGYVEISTASGWTTKVRPSAEVRLHGRGIPA